MLSPQGGQVRSGADGLATLPLPEKEAKGFGLIVTRLGDDADSIPEFRCRRCSIDKMRERSVETTWERTTPFQSCRLQEGAGWRPKSVRMFTEETYRFLEDLAGNNNRTWYEENKPRYEAAVRQPALAFIEAVGQELRDRVSPHLKATTRSLFRIHRDTRFSKDKTPYKTHVGLYFPHGGTPAGSRSSEKGVREDVHLPGFYLHLEPGNSFAGCGLWHPPNDHLNRIREAIVEDDEAWAAVQEQGLHLGGDSLKRPPAGFPRDHRFVDDLMRKDFITSHPFTEQEICGPNLVERFVEECQRTAPLVRFLCGALDLPW